MPIDTPSATQLSQVISQVTAPSFLLGAVAAFVSVLIGRMNRIIDRLQALNAISDDDSSKAHLKTDVPHLRRRAALLNKAIVFSTISAIVTSLLVIVAFIAAFFQLRHEYGVAILFIVALSFFTLSLVDLAREARISLHDIGHHK
jgi:O-antigen ligase